MAMLFARKALYFDQTLKRLAHLVAMSPTTKESEPIPGSSFSLNLGNECDQHCNVTGNQSRGFPRSNSNEARPIHRPASRMPQHARFANYLPNSLHLSAFSRDLEMSLDTVREREVQGDARRSVVQLPPPPPTTLLHYDIRFAHEH